MADPFITFIGGGNMANAIIGGLVAQGFDAARIMACDPLPANREQLAKSYAVQTSADNKQGASLADALVLAVKPQVMAQVCADLRGHLPLKPVVISIAAGIPVAAIASGLGEELAIVRCMPNTPALVGLGASGLFGNSHLGEAQKQLAERILGAVGLVEWLDDEKLMDTVTAVSGSGPAYFFLLMEAMIEAGVKQGLDRQTAIQLTLQTCIGAGRLAQNSDVDVAELRRRVTSPNGTTERAIASFEADGFRDMVERALDACAERGREMAKDYS